MKLSITLVVSIIIINRFTVKYLKNYVVYKIVPKNGGITPFVGNANCMCRLEQIISLASERQNVTKQRFY